MTEQPNFTVSARDGNLISKIALRARALEAKYAEAGDKCRTIMDWRMDITATHANGNPLRLADMLEADDFNFGHDVFGICRHLDRDTGRLTGFFSPRFTSRQAA